MTALITTREAIAQMTASYEAGQEDARRLAALEIETLRAENARLRVAIAEMAIPYEALRLDDGSRKWIAPEVWKHIVEATIAARAALTPEAA